MRSAVAGLALLLLLAGGGAGRAEDVDLQVVLAADVSRSIDDGEFDLQRKGYAAAMSDPGVLAAIRKGAHKAIAVCFVEWSGTGEQKVVVDWQRLSDEEDAGGIAAAILAAPRSYTGRTSIGDAIDFAVRRLQAAPWRGTRRVIDVSGDGTSNSGRDLAAARDDAVKAGITINGLAIVNNSQEMAYSSHTHPPGGLPAYYTKNVIGGAGAFLLVVSDFNSFAEAMAKKLAKEINISREAAASSFAGAPLGSITR